MEVRGPQVMGLIGARLFRTTPETLLLGLKGPPAAVEEALIYPVIYG